jgi:glutamine synthetase
VIATASNDHRLGANEAPPAIISVYLGSQLEDVFNQIKAGALKSSASGGVMQLGVDSLPEFPKDAGDRNRTSPFAFTGNRFEFRAVGSGQSVAGPLVALNTILADSLGWIADQLEARLAKGESLSAASFAVLQQITRDHGAVIFGGDGYSSAWHEQAVQERGLENLRTSADALPVLQRDAIRELFSRHNVLSPVELESRFEVYAEQYCLAIEVEARLVVRLARTVIFPAVSAYLAELATAIQEQEAIGLQPSKALAQQIAGLSQQLLDGAAALEAALGAAPHGAQAHMRHCADTLMARMAEVRAAADSLETLVDDAAWPLPTYQEMLFVR